VSETHTGVTVKPTRTKQGSNSNPMTVEATAGIPQLCDSHTSEPECFVLVLRPVPNWRYGGPIQRLKLACKALLRGYGLKIISCEERKEPIK
jgi:hypothetical protein